jgi:hypothetical protein
VLAVCACRVKQTCATTASGAISSWGPQKDPHRICNSLAFGTRGVRTARRSFLGRRGRARYLRSAWKKALKLPSRSGVTTSAPVDLCSVSASRMVS